MLFQVNSLTQRVLFGAILPKRAIQGRHHFTGWPVKMIPIVHSSFLLYHEAMLHDHDLHELRSAVLLYHVQNQHMIQFAVLALIILQLFW